MFGSFLFVSACTRVYSGSAAEIKHSMSLQKDELVLNICSLKPFSSTLSLPSCKENNIFFHQGRDILGEETRKLHPKHSDVK